MHTLVIITTRNISQQKGQDESFLFQKKHEQSGTKIPIYRYPGQLLFAADALPGDSISVSEATRYVNQVVKNAWQLLSDDEKNRIKYIKLILHRKELGEETTTYQIIQEGSRMEQLFSQLKEWLKDQFPKPIELAPKKPIDEEKDYLYIEFVAFSHDPGHLVKDVLCKPKDIGLFTKADWGAFIKEELDADKYIREEKEILRLEKSYAGRFLKTSSFRFDFFEYAGPPKFSSNKNESRANDYGMDIHQFHSEPDEFSEAAKTVISLINKSFIQEEKPEKNGSQSHDIPANGNRIAILFIPSSYLRHYEVLKQSAAFSITKRLLDRKDIPLITISYKDIMLGREPKNSIFDYWNPPDPRFRFMDSSIWYRYVPLETVMEEDGIAKTFKDHFQEALDTIGWAYQRGLYQKSVAFEHRELAVRMLCNSFLDDSSAGGHGSKVFPFSFHSESALMRTAAKFQEKLWIKDLKWRFLLIDDFANKELRDRSQRETAFPYSSKKVELIRYLIQDTPYANKKSNQDSTIELHTEINIPDAIAHIKKSSNKQIYDIILLDYLFSEDNEQTGYGTEFFERIRKNGNTTEERLTEGKSILQNYWVHPISVFPDAMHASFLEKSIQSLEEDWQLARGADPVNTPHLFRLSLFEFMHAQLQKLIFKEEEVFEFLLENPFPNMAKEEQLAAVRNWGKVTLNKLISRFSHLDGLPEKSLLADSIKKHIEWKNLETIKDKLTFEFTKSIKTSHTLWQHLRQLCFFLGYSTGFDEGEVKKAYHSIFRLFEKQKEKLEHREAIEKELENLSSYIFGISHKYF